MKKAVRTVNEKWIEYSEQSRGRRARVREIEKEEPERLKNERKVD